MRNSKVKHGYLLQYAYFMKVNRSGIKGDLLGINPDEIPDSSLSIMLRMSMEAIAKEVGKSNLLI